MAILKALEVGGSILRPQFRDSVVALIKSGLFGGTKHWHPGAEIHPSSIIHAAASVDDGVVVGPFCVVGEGVILGSGCRLMSHVCVHGNTILGNDSIIHPFASVGGDPQDLKYKGENSWLILGPKNTIREHATINRGTTGGGGYTVGHDCRIGNNVVVSTGAGLAGHVVVEDGATIGGLTGIRQRVRIGRGAMVGGKSAVINDVLPYTLAAGNPAIFAGLNLVGLRRQHCAKEEMRALSECLRVIYHAGDKQPSEGPNESWLDGKRPSDGSDKSLLEGKQATDDSNESLQERVEDMRRKVGRAYARVDHLLEFLCRPMPCGICRSGTPPTHQI